MQLQCASGGATVWHDPLNNRCSLAHSGKHTHTHERNTQTLTNRSRNNPIHPHMHKIHVLYVTSPRRWHPPTLQSVWQWKQMSCPFFFFFLVFFSSWISSWHWYSDLSLSGYRNWQKSIFSKLTTQKLKSWYLCSEGVSESFQRSQWRGEKKQQSTLPDSVVTVEFILRASQALMPYLHYLHLRVSGRTLRSLLEIDSDVDSSSGGLRMFEGRGERNEKDTNMYRGKVHPTWHLVMFNLPLGRPGRHFCCVFFKQGGTRSPPVDSSNMLLQNWYHTSCHKTSVTCFTVIFDVFSVDVLNVKKISEYDDVPKTRSGGGDEDLC